MNYRKGLTALAVLAIPYCLSAMPWTPSVDGQAELPDTSTWQIQPTIGLAAVSATELVYDEDIRPGYKLSQLDWSDDAVFLIGLGAEWRKKRLSARGGIWTSIFSTGGELTNTDWQFETTGDWTDRTVSDAEVSIIGIDFNIGWTLVHRPSWQLDLLGGYRYELHSWTDSDGAGIHTERTFRDTPVEFEGVGIEYEQSMQIPYGGLQIAFRISPTHRLSGYLIYSPIVSLDAEDVHYGDEEGDTIFTDRFSNASYIATGIALDWDYSQRLHLSFGIHYQRIPRVQGDGLIDDDEGIFLNENGAGAAHRLLMGSIALNYRF